MAVEQNISTRSVPVTGDLSANQYYFAKLANTGLLVLCSAATDVPYGVIQNKPKSTGEVGVVAVEGLTKCVASGVINIGDRVAPTAAGKAATAAGGNRACGIARTAAGADGDIFSLELNIGSELV